MAWMLKKYWIWLIYVAVVAFCIVGIESYKIINSKPIIASSIETSAAMVPLSPNSPLPPGGITLRQTHAGAGVFSVSSMEVIRQAAIRNHCYGDSFYLLLAIRKSENGGDRRQFGIENKRCDEIMKQRPDETLDIQAGWAAASIVKSHGRYLGAGGDRVVGDEFIEFMAKRYCPPIGDGSNHENWKRNVKFWYSKLKLSAVSVQHVEVAGL